MALSRKEKRRIHEDPASSLTKEEGHPFRDGLLGKAPGDDLLLHGLSHTTIGAVAFHFRVREGIGWFHNAMVTRETVGGSRGGVLEGTSHAHALTFGVA